MAFGLSPKHQQDLLLADLTPAQFLVLAIATAKKLEWNIGSITEKELTAYTSFSMSSYSEEVTIHMEAGKAILISICTGSQLTDWGKNKRNIADFILVFNQLKEAATPEELQQKAVELHPGLVPQTEETGRPVPAGGGNNVSEFLSVFKPATGYIITPVLLNLNIGIFIFMAISGVNILMPDHDSLLQWGANFKVLTLAGEWWRLITSCFIHIGILHLLMNMYGLSYIGSLLEPYLGKARFTTAYLLAGITGSMTSLYWHDLTISAGASGAIFGMYGVFLAMLTTNLIEKTARKAMLNSTLFFVGFNLLFGLKGGIDNAAHIGGLVGGIVMGYAYYPGLIRTEVVKLKYLTIGLLTTVILVGSYLVYINIPNTLAVYDKKMEQFMSMESMALEVYNLPDTAPKEELLSEIKDRGIYYWKENMNLLNELKALHLPDEIDARNEKLIRYCQLRIKSYELLYKRVEENSAQYTQQIESYDKQIQLVVNELSGKGIDKEPK